MSDFQPFHSVGLLSNAQWRLAIDQMPSTAIVPSSHKRLWSTPVSTSSSPAATPPPARRGVVAGSHSGSTSGGSELDITAMSAWDTHLFLGTSSGQLWRLDLIDGLFEPSFVSRVQVSSSKRSIDSIIVCDGVGRVVVLTEAQLFFFDIVSMDIVGALTGIKGVTCITHDSHPHAAGVDLVVFKRRSMQLYRVESAKCVVEREYPLSESVHCARRFGDVLCFADTENYVMLSLSSGLSMPLFPHNSPSSSLVAAVGDDEFLVASSSPGDSSAVGVFVSIKGMAVRGTVMWEEKPLSICAQYPYIVSLHESSIQVHSCIHQNIVQVIPIGPDKVLISSSYFMVECRLLNCPPQEEGDDVKRGAYIINYSPVKNDYLVSALSMSNLDDQISSLIDLQRVDEALELLQNGQSHNQSIHMDRRMVEKKAAWTYFEAAKFKEAMALFIECRTSPEEILDLILGVDGLNSKLHMTLDEIIASRISALDINVDGQPEFKARMTKQAHNALVLYLHECTKVAGYDEKTVNSCLIKLYCTMQSPELYVFLKTSPQCKFEETGEYLRDNGKHYALSLLESNRREHCKVLDIWQRLAQGDLLDSDFPGLSIYVDYLFDNIQDASKFRSYLIWILTHRPEYSSSIFSRRDGPINLRTSSQIIEFLRTVGNMPLINYVEYLIYVGHTDDVAVHQEMFMLLLEEIRKCDKDLTVANILRNDYIGRQRQLMKASFAEFLSENAKVDPKYLDLRMKLLKLLKESSSIKPELINHIASDEAFSIERALLLSRAGSHAEVFQILVVDDRDFADAEWHCLNYPLRKYTDDPLALNNLVQDLFVQLILQYRNLEDEELQKLCIANILQSYHERLDMKKVISCIPSSWPVSFINDYFRCSMEYLKAETRITQYTKGIIISRHRELSQYKIKRGGKMFLYMPTGGRARSCRVCTLPLMPDNGMAAYYERFANGDDVRITAVMHVTCVKKYEEMEKDSQTKRHLRGALSS